MTAIAQITSQLVSLTTSTSETVVIRTVASLIVAAQELLQSVYTVILSVSAGAATAILEAVASLALVLSFTLTAVLQVVAKASELLHRLSVEVLNVCNSATNALTIVVKSLTTIVTSISQSCSKSGLVSSASFITKTLGSIISAFTMNANLILRILTNLKISIPNEVISAPSAKLTLAPTPVKVIEAETPKVVLKKKRNKSGSNSNLSEESTKGRKCLKIKSGKRKHSSGSGSSSGSSEEK